MIKSAFKKAFGAMLIIVLVTAYVMFLFKLYDIYQANQVVVQEDGPSLLDRFYRNE